MTYLNMEMARYDLSQYGDGQTALLPTHSCDESVAIRSLMSSNKNVVKDVIVRT